MRFKFAIKMIPYDRTLISKRFAAVPYSSIHENPNVCFHRRTELLGFDPSSKTVKLKSVKEDDSIKCGPKKRWELREMSYSKLVLATGLEPKIPFPNASTVTVYHAADVENVKNLVNSKHVLVLGGGLLGCETVSNLFKLKRANNMKSATVVMLEEEPLAELYGVEIGRVVRRQLEQHGVTVITGHSAVDASVGELVLDNGRRVSFDLLINAAGKGSENE